MRLIPILCLSLLELAVPAAARSEPGAGGNFYARIRANDAPIAGRFTIAAYFLDTLDVAVALPGPGRLLAVHFRESNGENAFIVPGDLELAGRRETRWKGGFAPAGPKRLGGLLAKEETRWAFWWVPQGRDTLLWQDPTDLQLHYGFSRSVFVPLGGKDASATLGALPWGDLPALVLDPDRGTGASWFPDPAVFDQTPVVKERRNPEYPRIARSYDFEGTVHVVARVTDTGQVEDAYVLQSVALHELQISALVAVMDWKFKPGRKGGQPVAGEMVIPVVFNLGTIK